MEYKVGDIIDIPPVGKCVIKEICDNGIVVECCDGPITVGTQGEEK